MSLMIIVYTCVYLSLCNFSTRATNISCQCICVTVWFRWLSKITFNSVLIKIFTVIYNGNYIAPIIFWRIGSLNGFRTLTESCKRYVYLYLWFVLQMTPLWTQPFIRFCKPLHVFYFIHFLFYFMNFFEKVFSNERLHHINNNLSDAKMLRNRS